MNLWMWAIAGGLVGTVMMDAAGQIASLMKIRWGG